MYDCVLNPSRVFDYAEKGDENSKSLVTPLHFTAQTAGEFLSCELPLKSVRRVQMSSL